MINTLVKAMPLEAMNAPLFSIITPCLNRVEYIRDAVESVLAQKYISFEHIIVDGGSTDGTLEILKQYPHLQVQVGQDQGMYDALNRGLKLAKGEIIGFLNSDDLYVEDAFAIIDEKFRKQNILTVAGGALIFTESPDGEIKNIRSYSQQGNSLLEISTIGDPYFNAWFFHRSIFDKIGNFNIHYRIAADREFMLRYALSGLNYITINNSVYRYRKHADSMTLGLTDPKLQRIIDENIYITSDYLEKKNLPREARKLISLFRTGETTAMAASCLKKFNLLKFVYYSKRGIKYDPFWFLNLIRRAAHKKPRGYFKYSRHRLGCS